VREYFANETLPEVGTKCEASVSLYGNETAEEAFEPIANFSKRGVEVDDERALLNAMKVLSAKRAPRLGH
jgi:hypothetical protein